MISVNQHQIQFSDITEMGGGVEEYHAWCVECDPEGQDILIVDARDYPSKEGVARLLSKVGAHVMNL